MKLKTLDFLDQIMGGHQVTASELDEMLAAQVKEDDHLEYKDGGELSKGKGAQQTIRAYLSAFANSAGGVLLVGVNEERWEVTGCPPMGQSLIEWASRCLTEIAPHFSPLPRLQQIIHPRGSVLVAATYRSAALIPVREGGRNRYYFRLGDQTLPASEFLISDLLLGRRERPQPEVIDVRIANLNIGNDRFARFQVWVVVENQGLSWVDGVRVGMLCWNRSREPVDIHSVLRSNTDIVTPLPPEQFPGTSNLRHFVSAERSSVPMEPLSRLQLALGECVVPWRFGPYEWRAALYLVARNLPPVWYQLSLTVTEALENQSGIAAERTWNERPTVTWARWQHANS
jgi:hypothetical protein